MKKFNKAKYLILLNAFVLLVCVNANAQEIEDIVTDRPDQTESSETLPKGFVQVELGGDYEHDKTGGEDLLNPARGTRIITAPAVLIRWGIINNVELRFSSEYISSKVTSDLMTITESSVSGTTSGIRDLGVGTKIKLFTEQKARPDAAFLFTLHIPVNNELSPEDVASEFRFAFSHTLTKKLSLSYNLGGVWDGDSPSPFGIYTISLGTDLASSVAAYIELYGFSTKHQLPDHRLDGGLTFLFARNLQADLSGGVGLSEVSPDFFFGLGLSLRLPK